MKSPAYQLDATRRSLVLQAVKEVCRFRAWELLAVHVRTAHVHAVISAEPPPEKVMTDLKAYASRRLNEAELDVPGQQRWSRHGSTVYLWTPGMLHGAIDYVLNEQGTPMAVFAASGAAASGAATVRERPLSNHAN
jgi:REP element-mobilizing transposase RayT